MLRGICFQISTLCCRLIYLKLTQYLKKLQQFNYQAFAETTQNNKSIFWKTIQRIYYDHVFCNVQIWIYMVDTQHEATYFDNETFNVKCQFQISEFKYIAWQFHFLNLNSITVQYASDPTSDIEMSDLFGFAVPHQQVQVYITIGEQQLILYIYGISP